MADTMMTCSCRTWLCLTLARSASGVVSLVGCGKMAVPGTRVTGVACSCWTNSASGPSSRFRISVTMPRPLLPGRHDREHHRGDNQRQPATVKHLGQVGGQERRLGSAKGDGGDGELPRTPAE